MKDKSRKLQLLEELEAELEDGESSEFEKELRPADKARAEMAGDDSDAMAEDVPPLRPDPGSDDDDDELMALYSKFKDC